MSRTLSLGLGGKLTLSALGCSRRRAGGEVESKESIGFESKRYAFQDNSEDQ